MNFLLFELYHLSCNIYIFCNRNSYYTWISNLDLSAKVDELPCFDFDELQSFGCSIWKRVSCAETRPEKNLVLVIAVMQALKHPSFPPRHSKGGTVTELKSPGTGLFLFPISCSKIRTQHHDLPEDENISEGEQILASNPYPEAE